MNMEERTEEIIIDNDNFNVSINEQGFILTTKNQEKYTLQDLKQKLINDMFNKDYYNEIDIEILKILFENNDI